MILFNIFLYFVFSSAPDSTSCVALTLAAVLCFTTDGAPYRKLIKFGSQKIFGAHGLVHV